MAGQPELDEILDGPQLRQLKQRIALHVKLRPLTLGETVVYIHHRLRVAGANGLIRFTSQAVDLIFTQSRGVPRIINKLCNAALLAGYVAGQRVIAKKTAEVGIRELFNGAGGVGGSPQEGLGGTRQFSRTTLAIAFAVYLIVLAYLVF